MIEKFKTDIILKILAGLTTASGLIFLFVYTFLSHTIGYTERSSESEIYYIITFVLGGITLNYILIKAAALLKYSVITRVLLAVIGLVVMNIVIAGIYVYSSFSLYYVF